LARRHVLPHLRVHGYNGWTDEQRPRERRGRGCRKASLTRGVAGGRHIQSAIFAGHGVGVAGAGLPVRHRGAPAKRPSEMGAGATNRLALSGLLAVAAEILDCSGPTIGRLVACGDLTSSARHRCCDRPWGCLLSKFPVSSSFNHRPGGDTDSFDGISQDLLELAERSTPIADIRAPGTCGTCQA
jgi:hypothetical protein